MTTLHWTSPFWPSLFHALRALTEGHSIADPALATTLRPFAHSLRSWSLPNSWWSRAISSVAREDALGPDSLGRWIPPSREGGRQTEARDLELIGHFEQAAEALCRDRPRLTHELPLRLGPIRQEWLARGPGLMFQLTRAIAPSKLAPSHVQVVGVVPICGGFGEAYPCDASLLIEAMLTNANDQLPELARLAWLVVQVTLHNCWLAESPLNAARSCPRLALLVTLALGQSLDWFSGSAPPLELALQNWLGWSEQVSESWAARLPEDWYQCPAAPADIDRLRECALTDPHSR